MFDRPAALLDLPGEVIDEICTILDSSTEHNWMKLVGYVPNYTHGDIIQLRNLAQQVNNYLKLNGLGSLTSAII